MSWWCGRGEWVTTPPMPILFCRDASQLKKIMPEACRLGDLTNLTMCQKTDGGAGFYRFPAWVRTKRNDVSPNHAIRKQRLEALR